MEGLVSQTFEQNSFRCGLKVDAARSRASICPSSRAWTRCGSREGKRFIAALPNELQCGMPSAQCTCVLTSLKNVLSYTTSFLCVGNGGRCQTASRRSENGQMDNPTKDITERTPVQVKSAHTGNPGGVQVLMTGPAIERPPTPLPSAQKSGQREYGTWWDRTRDFPCP